MRAAFLLILAAIPGLPAELPLLGLHHAAYYVSDADTARKFYQDTLGYTHMEGAWYKINDNQFLEIFPTLKPGSIERFAHYAIATSDLDGLRATLLARSIECSEISTGRDKNRKFTVTDPDGIRIEFVDQRPEGLHRQSGGKFNSPRRISPHLRHVGLKVRDEARSLAFYRDKLGFTETWRGGPTDNGPTAWINLALPGSSGDYIELMLYSGEPTRDQLGSMHHICLEVGSIQPTWAELKTRGIPDIPRHQPKTGRNKRWLLNLFDPDGTRVEIMEPRR